MTAEPHPYDEEEEEAAADVLVETGTDEAKAGRRAAAAAGRGEKDPEEGTGSGGCKEGVGKPPDGGGGGAPAPHPSLPSLAPGAFPVPGPGLSSSRTVANEEDEADPGGSHFPAADQIDPEDAPVLEGTLVDPPGEAPSEQQRRNPVQNVPEAQVKPVKSLWKQSCTLCLVLVVIPAVVIALSLALTLPNHGGGGSSSTGQQSRSAAVKSSQFVFWSTRSACQQPESADSAVEFSCNNNGRGALIAIEDSQGVECDLVNPQTARCRRFRGEGRPVPAAVLFSCTDLPEEDAEEEEEEEKEEEFSATISLSAREVDGCFNLENATGVVQYATIGSFCRTIDDRRLQEPPANGPDGPPEPPQESLPSVDTTAAGWEYRVSDVCDSGDLDVLDFLESSTNKTGLMNFCTDVSVCLMGDEECKVRTRGVEMQSPSCRYAHQGPSVEQMWALVRSVHPGIFYGEIAETVPESSLIHPRAVPPDRT
jgi:hypothetical protein